MILCKSYSKNIYFILSPLFSSLCFLFIPSAYFKVIDCLILSEDYEIKKWLKPLLLYYNFRRIPFLFEGFTYIKLNYKSPRIFNHANWRLAIYSLRIFIIYFSLPEKVIVNLLNGSFGRMSLLIQKFRSCFPNFLSLILL